MSDTTILEFSSGSISTDGQFQLVFHVNIFLVAVTAIFVLATLPRALARFSRVTEWWNGHILHSINLNNRRPRRLPPSPPPHSTSKVPASPPPDEPCTASSSGHDGVTSEESHTYVSHSNLIRRPTTGKAAENVLPPHVRAWSSILPPVGNLLRYRLDSGFSAGQALVLGVYTAVLIYPVFLKSDPFTDPLRTGFVAVSQMPLVYMLGTKNNILGMFLAMGYERVGNFMHFPTFMC